MHTTVSKVPLNIRYLSFHPKLKPSACFRVQRTWSSFTHASLRNQVLIFAMNVSIVNGIIEISLRRRVYYTYLDIHSTCF